MKIIVNLRFMVFRNTFVGVGQSQFENCNFVYHYNKKTKIIDLYNRCVTEIQKSVQSIDEVHFTNIIYEFAIECDDYVCPRIVYLPDAKLYKILKYLKIRKHLRLLKDNFGFGDCWKDVHGVKFFTHANEEIHKYSPHIHVRFKNVESSYSLLDGNKIIGENHPAKITKYIKNTIISNQKELLQFWLDTTNGILPEHNKLNIEIVD